jgi:tetratricopeptide (TPR) repeat protein
VCSLPEMPIANSRMRKLVLAASVLVASVPPVMNAAEHWIRLTTPHFEMWTTNSEKQGTAALNVFEEVRYFFLQTSKWKTEPSTTVRIVAFKSEKEFKPYRFSEGSAAYYLRTRKADYIVMQDISPEHYQTVMHEYTHLIMQHVDLKLPIWLNEGMADLYSTLEPRGNQALVGRPLVGQVILLMNQRWLDLTTLFDVGPNSPYYNERDKMSIFYSECWALTHMLAFSETYAPGFPKFFAAVASGRPVPDCLQSVYGKTLNQITRDLHAYINRSSLRAAIFDIKLGKLDLEPVVSEPSELAVDLALSDLLASQKKTQADASERLAKLALEHPESSDVQESLGYLAWDQGDPAKASKYFKAALSRGSKDAAMLSGYAQLLNESGSAEQILEVLGKIVEIKPEDQDAWFKIGATATRAGQYGSAVEALSRVKTVKADRASALFAMEAYCYLHLNKPEIARGLAEKARQYAKTPDQELRSSTIIRQLDSLGRQNDAQPLANAAASSALFEESPGPDPAVLRRGLNRELSRDEPSIHGAIHLQHVEAVAKFFDCATKIHRLRVTVDSREMVFELDNPSQIIVSNMKNGSLDMECGPQKPFRVGIFYLPSAQPAKADGMIRELVF